MTAFARCCWLKPGGCSRTASRSFTRRHGILEFAVDEQSAQNLAEILRGLGFRYAGRHRSKSVDVFRQGQINIILNSEQDSAASEHFQFHGPSVCAMAFRADNAQRVVQRAEVLLCPLWQEPVGPSERRFPALRAPDGTLLYLIDDALEPYQAKFGFLAGLGRRPPLISIDHVAQALPKGRLDNFTLFYRAIFGMLPEPLLKFLTQWA